MRRLIRVALALAGLLVLAAGLMIANAHRALRLLRSPLPSVEAVLDVDASADLPSGPYVIDTASQRMPRSAVLDPSLDPDPSAAYVMTHAAFVLAWPDGRLFLIDAGMDPEAARAFGRPLETFSGADPIEPHGSVAALLGPAFSRVRGLAFSHLHTDHTNGLAALCATIELSLPVFQTQPQHQQVNYTTRSGRAEISGAECARPTLLEGAALQPVPGFPGLFVVAAAGHTPGSQIVIAHVRGAAGTSIWIFTGDAVNHRDGIAHDVPKPWLYSLLVVPEDTERMRELRHWLRRLAADPRVRLAVPHDATGLDALGAAPWPRFLPGAS